MLCVIYLNVIKKYWAEVLQLIDTLVVIAAARHIVLCFYLDPKLHKDISSTPLVHTMPVCIPEKISAGMHSQMDRHRFLQGGLL